MGHLLLGCPQKRFGSADPCVCRGPLPVVERCRPHGCHDLAGRDPVAIVQFDPHQVTAYGGCHAVTVVGPGLTLGRHRLLQGAADGPAGLDRQRPRPDGKDHQGKDRQGQQHQSNPFGRFLHT